MKALITGGGGFAGSHLAEYLLKQAQEVIVVVHPDESLANLAHFLPQLRVERADVCDRDRLSQVLRDTRPQSIYHLAALSSPADSFRDPTLTYEVNFGGTLNLLWAWRQLEMDCRMLYVSSSEVYGLVRGEDLPLREETGFRPANPYAGSKAAAELLAFQFFQSYGLPIIRARPFNHTGPRQSAAFVCSSLARQIVEINMGLRPPTVTVGNLNACRDFSDVRDIARGYHLLLEKGEPGDVYQLCSGRAVSIEAILNILKDSTPTPVQVTVDQPRRGTREAPALWGEFTKAERAAGWRPQYHLEATLGDLKLYWKRELQL